MMHPSSGSLRAPEHKEKQMAEKKIQPKLPTSDEPAAGARKATKTSARRVTNRKVARKVARKTSVKKI
jgi:hypothetical protein